jgi:galactokinase
MTGFRGLLTSSLPRGAGLSSSAALEMAAALALLGREAAGPPEPRAFAGRQAENAYVGVQSGVMDQFASAAGVADHAILLDCRSLEWRPVPLPLADCAMVVCHSGSSRRLDASAYNQRRAECERAVAAIAKLNPAVRSLRDVDPAMLESARDRMDDVAARRARHVVEENLRVLATERALAAGDLAAVGRLFAASHASLRDLFEVSSPELDALVEIATSTDGVVASRLTGAGFGGSTINLVRHGRVEAFRAAIEREYSERTGLRPAVFEVDAVDGASFIKA